MVTTLVSSRTAVRVVTTLASSRTAVRVVTIVVASRFLILGDVLRRLENLQLWCRKVLGANTPGLRTESVG